MVGSTVNAAEEVAAYILGVPEGETEVALVKVENNENNALCAYLPKTDEMEADFYTLSIASDDNTTAIENVEINENEEIYDITGRKVNAITARGIYIINGKKVIK